MNRFNGMLRWSWVFLATSVLMLGLAGCDGTDGAAGIAGVDGDAGDPGAQGDPGATGDSGAAGDSGNVKIGSLHGTGMLMSTGDFMEAGKFYATATITAASAAVDGTVTVDFTIEDEAGLAVSGVTGMDFNIVKLAPASGEESYNKWVPYIYQTQTVTASGTGADDWPAADGTQAEQGYRESNGTFTDNGDGSYSYIFATNIADVVTPVTATEITYDRTLTHRVSVMMGGHSGATADANYDFVPDGSDVTEMRSIVETASCQNCHGMEFQGHGGDRLTVENCVTCHTAGNIDPHGGETLDMKVMIHKIHAGGELPSIPGADGIVWNDPGTLPDESADNGEYAIWGYRNTKHEWWKAEFPAVIENCNKCHQGIGANVDNWKTVPSRAACGSCHDDVDFESGINHGGGVVADDNLCQVCHTPDTGGLGKSVAEAHDWTDDDQRNIPEFDIDLTVSAPANGTHFVAGEAPLVSVVIYDNASPIDHTTVLKDTVKEGCQADACPPADGLFDHAYLFVHGPRGERNPVLTTTARAEIVSNIAGNFDLSTAASLDLIVDSGQDLMLTANGGQRLSGDISVSVDAAAFADAAAATPAEIVTWLNADSDFAARAIAYLENGFVAIRSRNLGKFFALQLQASDVNTAVFGGDTSVNVIGGYYPSVDLTRHADPADDDPKASWAAEAITYALDPVDDMQPGTYVASVEITDRGRINGTDYKTPSVAKTTFQVGMAAEEAAPAGNCGMCHQGPDGKGYVLDFARHFKIFDNTAVDQCGACHDYQSGHADGEWYGGKAISKRVHAVHNGSKLHYPNLTVDYNDPVKGRNWDIEFPQDVRNCETCHPPGTTSGSWQTEAARLPCMGCHDSEAATAHMKLQTYDPTPMNPWNGDEEESCQTCH